MNHPEHPAEHIAHTVNKAAFIGQLSQFLKAENVLSAPEAEVFHAHRTRLSKLAHEAKCVTG